MPSMAAPFLKWAGGKSRLVPTVAEAITDLHPKRYLEPFLGGGAMFFGLRARGLRCPAVLNDFNPLLVEAYALIRDDVESLIPELEHLARPYLAADANERTRIYYAVRASAPSTLATRVARLIFLNRTCFNGLYRVNRQGEFNVPHGTYNNPRISDPAGLRACADALAGTVFTTGDFAAVCEPAGEGDLVYLDPPYQPLTTTSSFTAYTDASFVMADQVRLAEQVRAMSERGAFVVLSNSTHPAVEDLYADFDVRRVKMARAINATAEGRGPIDELLITNFPWQPPSEISAEQEAEPDLQIA